MSKDMHMVRVITAYGHKEPDSYLALGIQHNKFHYIE